MSHVDLLRSTELFSKLTDDELESVSRCVIEGDAKEGETIIAQDGPGEYLYLVRAGRVAVEKTVGERRVRLAELGPGAVFGGMSLLDSFTTSATVTAIEATSYLLIGRLDLNVLLTWDPVLGSKLWRSFTEMLSYRIRSSNERLFDRFGEEVTSEFIAPSLAGTD